MIIRSSYPQELWTICLNTNWLNFKSFGGYRIVTNHTRPDLYTVIHISTPGLSGLDYVQPNDETGTTVRIDNRYRSIVERRSRSIVGGSKKVESAAETIKRIFGKGDHSVGTELAQTSRRYENLQRLKFEKPAATRRIAVANQKGGVGKTTTTVNLAAAFADKGARVLLIDMDPQGNASTAVGAQHGSGEPSVYDVLEGRLGIEDVVVPCKDFPRLEVVPSSIDLSGAELEVADLDNRTELLKDALDRFLDGSKEHFDYVFVDCPPSLGLLVINAMCAVTEMLIPIQAEYYALEGLGQLVNTIGLVQQHYNPRLLISTMIITMFDRRTLLSHEVFDQVKAHYPEIVLEATIPRAVKISEAPSFGQTVLAYDPKGLGSIAYVEAAYEIAQRSPAVLSRLQERQEDN